MGQNTDGVASSVLSWSDRERPWESCCGGVVWGVGWGGGRGGGRGGVSYFLRVAVSGVAVRAWCARRRERRREKNAETGLL